MSETPDVIGHAASVTLAGTASVVVPGHGTVAMRSTRAEPGELDLTAPAAGVLQLGLHGPGGDLLTLSGTLRSGETTKSAHVAMLLHEAGAFADTSAGTPCTVHVTALSESGVRGTLSCLVTAGNAQATVTASFAGTPR